MDENIYSETCKFCGEEFTCLNTKGYIKQLKHNLLVHEMSCRKKQNKLEEENGRRV